MHRKLVLTILLLGSLLSLPAAAQIQYFGYVGGADDDFSITVTNGFVNFAHLSAPADLNSTVIVTRMNALSQKGWKATIDLGQVLWCDYDGNGSYRQLCWNWTQRWTTWKQNNASVLTADKVLAFDILDEPFNRGAYMNDFETAAQQVKADFPWAKTWMTEAACVIAGTCSPNWPSPGLGGYQGSLPGIDWLGLDAYGIHPSTDWAFQNARTTLKGRFQGRKWIYVLDGYWDPNLHGVNLSSMNDMGTIADEWYGVARNDPDAVLLGAFAWPPVPDMGWTTSEQFSCDILSHHVPIGRAITHKTRPQTALPIGSFSIDVNGILSGWACDPDGTLCEIPQIDLYSDGVSYGSVFYGATLGDAMVTSRCSSGIAYRFTRPLNGGQSGHRITAVARDLDSGSTNLPSTCPENPACIWYSQYYAPKGYLDNVDATGYATGWVCDQDAPAVSSQVRFAAGGTYVGLYTTNLGNEQAVTTQCGGGTLHRFGVQLPAWTRGYQVIAYAENLGSPYAFQEVQIPVLCPNGRCIWP